MLQSNRHVRIFFGLVLGSVAISACTKDSTTPEAADSSSPVESETKKNRSDMSRKVYRWEPIFDEDSKELVRLGVRRLGIDVNAYTPSNLGPATFVVRLLNAKGDVNKEVARFGLSSNTPFRAADNGAPQRFQFSLKEHAKLLDDTGLKIEIATEPDVQEGGGVLELSMYWLDIK